MHCQKPHQECLDIEPITHPLLVSVFDLCFLINLHLEAPSLFFSFSARAVLTLPKNCRRAISSCVNVCVYFHTILAHLAEATYSLSLISTLLYKVGTCFRGTPLRGAPAAWFGNGGHRLASLVPPAVTTMMDTCSSTSRSTDRLTLPPAINPEQVDTSHPSSAAASSRICCCEQYSSCSVW